MKAESKKPVGKLKQAAVLAPMAPTGAPGEGPKAIAGAEDSHSAAMGKPWVAFNGDTTELILQMRSGTPARSVAGVAANLGLSQDKLFDLLRLPKSTVKGRISADGKLSATEQDRMYRAEKVLSRAVQVLEDVDAAKAWLARKNRSLGGEVPLALLDTEVGYELVLDTLGRIEYGVVS
jgi:putative toxin-antitoxin system antitoxin component (TIGR02293 family)